ncbi:MAG TPA: methionine--tRNA ligase [Bacteroidetes bacterium]|nr:methionine--tRNA ligase [Bacteroidota bacterium]
MDKNKKYLITSALPYANGALHLGHLSGAYLPADIYVRYLRLQGRDVAFICGSDEHGAAITIRAKKEGISPKDIIDKYHSLNKSTFEKLGISFDYYHRTSEKLHHETAQGIFKKLLEKGGELEEKTTEQYYDEEFKQFLADRYITGECPKCGHSEAYGDQCEKCGSTLSPTELVNPKSTLSGNTPILKKTKHWYFRLDKHADWLRDWIKNGMLDGKQHHDSKTWKKHVVGQCLSWLNDKEGLQPRSVTRDLDWGISVPVEGADGKVLYVWFDAPIGYISSTRQWALENGKNWEEYWKQGPDKLELVHFIGKDNIVFHCIIFPAMLKAHGEYALPMNVPANQFLNFEGRKFSKSKGWGIEQHEYLEEFKDFPNKEDALRWALIRNMPENRDSDFKWDEFVDHYDKDLADNLGNFINRVVVLTNSYFEGKVPAAAIADDEAAFIEKLKPVKKLANSVIDEIEKFNFRAAAAALMELSSWGNQYLQDAAPWAARKSDPDAEIIKESLFVSLQTVAALSILCEPFIPFTSLRIRQLLNLPKAKNGILELVEAKLKLGKPLIPVGHKIGKPAILFAKIHDRKDKSRLEIIERQKAKLEAVLAAEKANERPPIKPETTFDDFTKLDIRTGTVLTAEAVPKTKKLLKLTVDIGIETRTVVSGIAEHFKPEEVVGKKVLLLANLAPRKLRGVVSQGMVLMAEDAEGKLGFVSAGEAWGNGLTVR